MLLNVSDTSLLVSQSLCRVVPAQLLYEVLGPGGDVAREVNCVNALQNDVVGLHRVSSSKGRGTFGRRQKCMI